MEYLFRNCTMEDFDFLFELKKQNFKKYVDTYWNWNDEEQKERLRKDLEDHLSHKHIILIDNKPVGVYALHTTENGDCYINEISLIKEYQKRGIGTKILKEQLNKNSNKGVRTILQVFKANPAKYLYERLGFTIYGETETHYQMEVYRKDMENRYMKIVTSGSKYIDIDAYAGIIAYAYFLNLKGVQAKAVSTAKLNESITCSLLNLDIGLDEYEKNDDDEYIIIDVSNKDYFDNIVNENKIVEVIDHHTGFEEYWKEKLEKKARIEFIGSVATIIFEDYEKENLLSKMPKEIAILLMSAILDNTLNFKANVTSERDKSAYKKLAQIAGNMVNYEEKYFLECQKNIEDNLEMSIENDTKTERICDILPYAFSQLTLWDKKIILDNRDKVYKTLNTISNEWMMNVISLEDGKSYIITNNIGVQKNLEKLFCKLFDDDIMELDNVWLRKEIIKKAREYK